MFKLYLLQLVYELALCFFNLTSFRRNHFGTVQKMVSKCVDETILNLVSSRATCPRRARANTFYYDSIARRYCGRFGRPRLLNFEHEEPIQPIEGWITNEPLDLNNNLN